MAIDLTNLRYSPAKAQAKQKGSNKAKQIDNGLDYQPKRVLRPLASRVNTPQSADAPTAKGEEAEKAAASADTGKNDLILLSFLFFYFDLLSSSITVGPILYRPGKEFAGLEDYVGKSLVVHVPAKYLTTKNQQVSLLLHTHRTYLC